jgi:polar amino acid transport system substrate-binding protein
MKFALLLTTISLPFCLAIHPVLGAESISINLHYTLRPPYIELSNSKVTGLFATPAEEAFRKARINFTWTQTPLNRQLIILKENKGHDCAVGYFKNSERESFAIFTRPIYHSKPMVVVANLDIKHSKTTTFRELATNPENIFLMKENYSYGEDLDKLIKVLRPNKYITNAEAPQMLQMIKVRSHYLMMASQEEMDYYLDKQSVIDRKDIQMISLRASIAVSCAVRKLGSK